MALVGVIVLLLVSVMSAPALIAEVFLDAFLVSVLYRKLRIAAKEHWLGTAIRKTWVAVFALAALLAICGACLEALAPGTRSIGPALYQLFHKGG